MGRSSLKSKGASKNGRKAAAWRTPDDEDEVLGSVQWHEAAAPAAPAAHDHAAAAHKDENAAVPGVSSLQEQNAGSEDLAADHAKFKLKHASSPWRSNERPSVSKYLLDTAATSAPSSAAAASAAASAAAAAVALGVEGGEDEDEEEEGGSVFDGNGGEGRGASAAASGGGKGSKRKGKKGRAEEVVVDKFHLYQTAVQSPKGDISYLVRFFLEYIGGRAPLSLREDFSGTALICSEWLKSDPRRTALAVDLDRDALQWGLRHNFASHATTGASAAVADVGERDPGFSRIRLFYGNVLDDVSSMEEVVLAQQRPQQAAGGAEGGRAGVACEGSSFGGRVSGREDAGRAEEEAGDEGGFAGPSGSEECSFEKGNEDVGEGRTGRRDSEGEQGNGEGMGGEVAAAGSSREMPKMDLVCAFNFSVCCLHSRQHLLRYFRKARAAICPRKGGIFAMDLYGGTSSECALKLKRSYGDFMYTWEQEEFDISRRMTQISLHFKIMSINRVVRKAFSYRWRLWTIPELQECMLEAGFGATRLWMREMADLGEREDEEEEVEMDQSNEFKEVSHFLQCDSWNAYIVGIVFPKR